MVSCEQQKKITFRDSLCVSIISFFLVAFRCLSAFIKGNDVYHENALHLIMSLPPAHRSDSWHDWCMNSWFSRSQPAQLEMRPYHRFKILWCFRYLRQPDWDMPWCSIREGMESSVHLSSDEGQECHCVVKKFVYSHSVSVYTSPAWLSPRHRNLFIKEWKSQQLFLETAVIWNDVVSLVS